MKVKERDINYIVATITIVYMMFKTIIDNYTYSVLKPIFAASIVVYFFLFIFHKKIYNSDCALLIVFAMYSLYILTLCAVKNEMVYTRRAIYEYVMYSMILFMGTYISHNAKIERVYTSIKIIGSLLIITSIIEILGKAGEENFRILGTSRSVMAHGMLLGIYAQINLFFYLRECKYRYFMITVMTMIIIVTTGSRGAMVATFGGLLLQYIFWLYLQRNIKSILRIVSIVIVFSVLLYIFFSIDFKFSNSDIQYWIVRTQKIIDWNGDAGNVGRLFAWKRWIEIFKENIMFGIGPSKTGSWGSAAIGVTESGLIRHLVELGLVGFVLYYLPIIVCIVYTVKNRKYWQKDAHIILLHLGIVTSILIEDVVLQISEEITVAFFLWWSLGIIYEKSKKAKIENEYNSHQGDSYEKNFLHNEHRLELDKTETAFYCGTISKK